MVRREDWSAVGRRGDEAVESRGVYAQSVADDGVELSERKPPNRLPERGTIFCRT